MTTLYPLQRCSDRVQDYARYRPSYPEAAILTILASQGSQGSLWPWQALALVPASLPI